MIYRDLHPGDIILIWGDTKVVERVDRTHIATRGPNDHLELWAYGEDHLDFIKFENKLHLKNIGFIQDNEDLQFEASNGYVICWNKELCYIVNNNLEVLCRQKCTTLNQVQQFFYNITKEELNLDI